jgi:crotonobetainyl-CoA:carnitine CoA-transferase CaiB-like acyl-CoA transferase
VPVLAEKLRQRTRADWLAALEAAKVPCGPINDLADVFADPQVVARKMTTTLTHRHADALELVASPIKLSATPVQTRRPPPLLGEHTYEILAEMGVTPAQQSRLQALGVIGLPPA